MSYNQKWMSIDGKNLTEEFAGRLRREGCAPGTIVKYTAAVRHYLSWLGGRDAMVQRRPNLETYLDEWFDEANPSPATQRARIAALHRFYEFLLSRDAAGDAVANPLDRVRRPPSRRKSNDRLTPEEDAAILAATIDAREAVVIALLRWAGLRVSEACAMRWCDVDERRGFLFVRSSKTEAGVRAVTLLDGLVGPLADWRRHLERHNLYDPVGPVLMTNRRTAMKTGFVWRVVKRVAARAGVRTRPAPDRSGQNVSSVTDHTLRRTFASDLLNREVRLEVVAVTLGHADTRVTQQYYAELQAERARTEILRAMGAS
jgi:integrase